MSAGSILAYLDRWSFRAGDALACRVSCDNAGSFNAELVRVIQGDKHVNGPGYREEKIPCDIAGPYLATHQPINAGSWALIDDAPALADLTSFTFTTAVWPTLPGAGAQTIMARLDQSTGYGFEIYIDAQGALAIEVNTAMGRAHLSTNRPMLVRRWYKVFVSYDATRGELLLRQLPKIVYADVAGQLTDGVGEVQATQLTLGQIDCSAPLTLACRLHPDHKQRRFFNGRMDNATLHNRPRVNPVGASDAVNSSLQGDSLVAAWDLSIDIASSKIVDTSGNNLHGQLFHLPSRGVTGYHWDGTSNRWSEHPQHYSAIHFHEDDLYDAGWQESFSFRIPADLKSGVYALRLFTHDDEFYTPFALLPAINADKSKAVFLLPTASYMAYANNRIGLDVPETELVCGRLIELTEQDLFMQTHPELGLCFYDLHIDGSVVYYSSRLRPVMDMQPGFVGKLGGVGSNLWQFNADTHILGWLESLNLEFDVATDEELHNEGVSCIADYRVLITGTHPEYYSHAMRNALNQYCEGDGRLMYMGGNGFYWRIHFHPELPGVIECRKSEDGIRAGEPGPGEYYASFTGEYTGLWRRNGQAPNSLVGIGMVAQGFDISSPYFRTDASHDPRVDFIFKGIDAEMLGDFGLSGGAAAGLEVDASSHALGTPANALVIAASQRHTDLYLTTPEDMLDPAPGLGGTEAEIVRAEMVFFETAKGGAVFSTGSIAWAGSMAFDGYNNSIAQLTENVLSRFLEAKLFDVSS